jgi:hypothetical protein
MTFRAWLPLVAALGGVACGPIELGQDPRVLWWTDHESADTSTWTSDGQGYVWTDQGGALGVTSAYRRSGHFALQATVASPGTDIQSAGTVSRIWEDPADAFYSAWFFIPQPITTTSYWVLFKFRSRSPQSEVGDVDLWDVDVTTSTSGQMVFQLYGHTLAEQPGPSTLGVPLGRWFQIEAFLAPRTDATGELTVWVDGTRLHQVAQLATVPSPYLEWSVGGITETIEPIGARVAIDDAAITTERLGPDFPVFE